MSPLSFDRYHHQRNRRKERERTEREPSPLIKVPSNDDCRREGERKREMVGAIVGTIRDLGLTTVTTSVIHSFVTIQVVLLVVSLFLHFHFHGYSL